MEIDIYADVICPWCYLGTHRLGQALAGLPIEPIVRYRPFQLDPGAPAEPVSTLGWLGARYGGEARARQMTSQVAALAAAEGLSLNFDRALIVNTLAAHRLIWFAGTPTAVAFGANADTQPEVAQALYRAHFTDGLNINSVDVLANIAVTAGLAEDRVRALLNSGEGTAEVGAEIANARDLGVTSVPTFVLAGAYVVTGAQDAETMREVLAEVVRREAAQR